jgi:hypothetical protein
MTSTSVLASSILAAALWVTPAAGDSFDPTFIAVLNGAQETPPVASPSTGVAFLTFNKNNSQLCYALSYSPLGGTELVAHFHGPTPTAPNEVAGPGVASGIRFFITGGDGPSPLGSPKNGCVGPLDKLELKGLKKGLWYINVHSSIAAAGEIRGQVLPLKGIKYKNVPALPASPSGAFLD